MSRFSLSESRQDSKMIPMTDLRSDRICRLIDDSENTMNHCIMVTQEIISIIAVFRGFVQFPEHIDRSDFL